MAALFFRYSAKMAASVSPLHGGSGHERAGKLGDASRLLRHLVHLRGRRCALGIGAVYLILNGPWHNETIQRYVHQLAEQAVVVLFFCCLAALLAKVLASLKERYALSQKLVPAWDGKVIPPAEVAKLRQALSLLPGSVVNTCAGRRVANILNFVASRNSATDLDDQMRTLADNDAMALDGSYALMRFIIWAMPILGFLGTVLGITAAIAGIDPEQLEKGGARRHRWPHTRPSTPPLSLSA